MNYFTRGCVLLMSAITFSLPAVAGQNSFAALEAASDGRLGVSALNTANNMWVEYRAQERFPMGCTSKLIGVAAILKQSMTDNSLLQQLVTYQKSDLTSWAPVTQKHVADGMTVAALAAAAVERSDNTAMNLLLKKLGGVAAVNAFTHSLGDDTFHLDRDYPAEAESKPGDLRDTSTPAAMVKSLQQIALGDVLTTSLRAQLQQWMKNNSLGDARIRAGVPHGWIVGDKTGTGSGYGATNDIAVIWPPSCPPIVVCIFYSGKQKNAVKREDVIAAATQIVLSEFAQTDKCIKV
jgi:beta-lactamase class A